MYSSKDAANPSYPTQWALNPNAYQNVDSSQVDWAALAQQWIAMKEAAVIVEAPPPPSMKPDAEEGEAPMEVENPDSAEPTVPPPPEWNTSTNSWGNNWNQWGWGWSGSSSADNKLAADQTMAIRQMMDYPGDSNAAMPGYTTAGVPTPTFQHGYWTAPQPSDDTSSRSSSRSRDRRSKSRNRDTKSTRIARMPRDNKIAPVMPPVMEPIMMPTPTIDAAKRRQLPAWIREGLEKMEREKQKALEREQEKKAREEAEKLKKRLEEEELARLKAEASGQPIPPPKSKFESDSEAEDTENIEEKSSSPVEGSNGNETPHEETQQSFKRSKEEIMQEVMLAVRRSLTEILLEVTDQEIQTVSQEELARYNAAQASRLNAMKASKSKALAAIASGLGLGAYESSSEESGDEDDQNDITDQQLQDMIKRKRQDFERTSRDIEAEVRRAELRESGDEPVTPVANTPDRPRRSQSSATPPPLESDTPEKLPERRISRDKKSNNSKSNDKLDGVKRLEVIPEEKPKKSSKRDYTPSPQKNSTKTNNKNSSTSSDTEADSPMSSSDSSSDNESVQKIETKQVKKRKRQNSSSSESHKKSKKDKYKNKSYKSDDKYSKSKHDGSERSEKSKSRRKEDSYRHKSSRSRDYDRSHKDKYRDDSEEERPRKRTKRSRSTSYESKSGRRRLSRDRSEEHSRRRDKRSYDRETSRRDRSYDRSGRDYDRSGRDYDKHDRYERSRDYDRRRSRSGSYSRHRR